MTSNDPTNETTDDSDQPVRLFADHDLIKQLGHWTTARTFAVRSRRGAVVLDLRSPRIDGGDISIDLDVDHGMVKLLVPEDASVDQTAIRWTGRGRVKDWQSREATGTARTIRLVGQVRSGEIRVHRGGIAVLSAMFSRAYIADLKRARRDGGMPTVDDPARDLRSA